MTSTVQIQSQQETQLAVPGKKADPTKVPVAAPQGFLSYFLPMPLSIQWNRIFGANFVSRLVLTTGQNEYRIAQLDNREMPQVAHVHEMTTDAKKGEKDRETINEREEQLGRDDGVDQAREELARQDCVFFDQFREVIESGCCSVANAVSRKSQKRWTERSHLTDCQGQEEEAQKHSSIPDQRKDPHGGKAMGCRVVIAALPKESSSVLGRLTWLL